MDQQSADKPLTESDVRDILDKKIRITPLVGEKLMDFMKKKMKEFKDKDDNQSVD